MLGIGLSLPVAALRRGGGVMPSLDLDFLSGAMDSRIAFSRASMAWQTDSTGRLVTAPHNLLTHSDFFANAAWVKTRSTVTANVLASPLDGSVTADKFVEQTDTATTRSMQNTIGVVLGNTYGFSVYAKAAERSAINLRFGSGFAAGNVTFDLSAGTLSSGGSVAASSITPAGNGWYRCFCAFVCTSSATAGAQIFLSSGGSITYDGVAGSGVYLFGAQVDQHNGSQARPYLSTSVKNLIGFTEAFDNAAWTKTNATVSANAATAPDGTLTADKLVENNTSAQHSVYGLGSITAGVTVTGSIYAKAAERSTLRFDVRSNGTTAGAFANFDLANGSFSGLTAGSGGTAISASITAVGSGWYRCSITCIVDASSTSSRLYVYLQNASVYSGDGTSGILIWGAQLSASGSIDAYVPNAGAVPASAAYHGPRLDYAITASTTNLLPQSGDIAAAPWSSTGTGTASSPIVTANHALAPDGTQTATRLQFNVGDGRTSADFSARTTALSGLLNPHDITYSFYVKSNTGATQRIALRQRNGSASFFNVTGDWTRISHTAPNVPDTLDAIQIGVRGDWIASQGLAQTADILVWGGQGELGTSVGPYVPTTTAAATLNTTSARGLLIEEARTNLFAGDMTNTTNWPSVGSVTRAAGAAAPDGGTGGLTVTENAGGTTSYGFNSTAMTITASTPATISIFAKAGTGTFLRLILSDALAPTVAAQAWFNLNAGTVGTTGIFSQSGGVPTGISASIQNAGGGWYRCILTATLASLTTAHMLLRMVNADNSSVDIGSRTMLFFGPQIEVGASATSPILTTTAAVTRAVDIATINPLGSWYNQAEGTLMVEANVPSFAHGPVIVGVSDGTFANSLYLWRVAADGIYQWAPNAAPTGLSIGLGNSASQPFKCALAYKLNDAAGSINGGAIVADTSMTPPAVTSMSIGKAPWASSSNYANGYIRRIRYWPVRRPNAELVTLTA